MCGIGYAVHGKRHFQSGFIMYNMRHPETYQIQSKWYQGIQEVGSLCQIPLYFIAQQFPQSIQEFL